MSERPHLANNMLLPPILAVHSMVSLRTGTFYVFFTGLTPNKNFYRLPSPPTGFSAWGWAPEKHTLNVYIYIDIYIQHGQTRL